jgi:hypothetical protein
MPLADKDEYVEEAQRLKVSSSRDHHRLDLISFPGLTAAENIEYSLMALGSWGLKPRDTKSSILSL